MHPTLSEQETVLFVPVAARERTAELVARLETTRRQRAHFEWGRWLLAGTLVVLTLAGLFATADWLWVLSGRVRGVGLFALLGVAAVFAGRAVAASLGRWGRQEAAAEVEAAFPQLGQRVRTTLQYREPAPGNAPADPQLVTALAADTEQRTRGLDFHGLIPWRSLGALALGLCLLVLLYGGLLAAREDARTAALRLLLVPATYTRLDVKPGDHTVKAGSDVAVEVTLTGRPVSTLELHHRPVGGDDWQTISLASEDEPEGKPARLLGPFGTTLSGCEQDLEYRVVAGPVESPVYRIHVLHPLVLKGFEARIEPPAYTRRPSQTVKDRDFKVIAGSAAQVHITLDREPERAALLLHPMNAEGKAAGGPRLLPLEPRKAELTGTLPAIDREAEVEIVAEAADGMKLEGEHFRIRVQPDGKPTVRFIKPTDTREVTPSTEVRMVVEAGDDFGLAKVGIVYQVGNGPKKTLLLHQDPQQPTRAVLEPALALEEHRLGFQDGVTYYAFAEDNRPGRPQRATTDLQFLDIRPYKRAYQLLKTGGS